MVLNSSVNASNDIVLSLLYCHNVLDTQAYVLTDIFKID